MTQIFKIKTGEIFLETDKINISDNSKKQRLLQLFGSGMWAIFGFSSVLRYFKTGDQFLLWTGLFIAIMHFVIFILNLFQSNQSEILFKDIKSIKVKKRFSNEFLDIRLKNNRLRRVMGIENSQELENYINLNIENTRMK